MHGSAIRHLQSDFYKREGKEHRKTSRVQDNFADILPVNETERIGNLPLIGFPPLKSVPLIDLILLDCTWLDCP
jgi:hypothetical protein